MLNRLYGWYGKRVVWGFIAILVLLICVVIFMRLGGTKEGGDETTTAVPRSVMVATVRDLRTSGQFSVVGTVRAVSEAKLETEAAGRITQVTVGVGDTVSAGTILASIENRSEQAALLQAEGAYESALAASRGNEVTLDEAKVAAQNAYRETFTRADTVVRIVIDQYYSNPEGAISGLRLSGTGNVQEFLAIRDDIGSQLRAWSESIRTQLGSTPEDELLNEAEATLITISDLAARIALILSDKKKNTFLTDVEREIQQAEIAGVRSTLDSALASLSNARRSYEQAQIGGGNTQSQSSALLKSALGTLRSAQANYEKTVVRTPIRGVVNALYIRAGEYVQQGQPAAIVANNGSLEIATALGEKDIDGVNVGDTVIIGQGTTGTITRVAPAVDPVTGKSEVLISIDDTGALKNGSTVTVSFSRTSEGNEVAQDSPMLIPLAALKFLAQGPVAFSVDENGTLVARPVVVGSVSGNAVLVTEGLDVDSRIVTDARGLTEGDLVTVMNP
jgi:multidrug efflux pump subunit AcrA (membrane-fusion protein)